MVMVAAQLVSQPVSHLQSINLMCKLPRHNSNRRAGAPIMIRNDLPEVVRKSVENDDLLIGTIELSDLPACVDVLMEGFYKDILTLAANEFGEEEMAILRPTLAKLNGSFTCFTRAFLTFDTVRRVGRRIFTGGLQRIGESSIFLAMKSISSGEIVGVVDLSEQPKDGRLPGDVRLPRWLSTPTPTVAYVASLSVRRNSRTQGLGRALLRVCAGVAREEWGYDEMYLHAATSDSALLGWYERLGYEQLPEFDAPKWVLVLSGREPTRFHRISLPLSA